MREFIYFSSKARTSGNFDTQELMKAGRMDIVCHVIINSFFISGKMRDDSIMHLVFYGSPDPPKHLEMHSSASNKIPETKEEAERKLDISKKDIAGIIKKMLYKYQKDKKTEVWPGYFVEKKSLFALIDELKEQGKEIYILDREGENLRSIKIDINNSVFLIGDHEGLPNKELKRLKKECKTISLGKTTYFASQAITILNHELDMREKG